jgi:protoheme IX farnesyltransferase
MATTNLVNPPIHANRILAKLRDYYTLTKPEVNLLILMTTSAGFVLGGTGALHWAGLVNTVLGTLLVASGTATLNQFMERRYDAAMRRTANRPLPAGRVSAAEAFWFGMGLSVAGGIYLWLAVNLLTAILATSTLLSYLLIYTPLKRKTPLCTLLGAFPGAMPTLIGWAGSANSLHREAWFLFAVLFLWQFPHFLAIALMYREDYSRAGYQMLPAFDRDGRFTRYEILTFTVVLIATTLLPAVGPGHNLIYALGVAASGAFFFYYTAKIFDENSRQAAARVVHASVMYLPVVLALMVFCKPE